MANFPELVERTVVVTGAASGIGQAVAAAYVTAGSKVFGCDIAGPPTSDVSLAGWGTVDVRDFHSVQTFVDEVAGSRGGIDVLVNAAGVGVPSEHFRSMHETEIEDWDFVVDINLTGGFRMAKAVVPWMLQSGGSIVNIASIMALVGNVGTAPYGASKHGIVGLTRVMALEYAKQGIRVNAVCPGYVDTPMIKRHMQQVEDPAAELATLNSLHPMGRIARPDEIADAVLWISSDAASFVTGVALPVDGGYTAA